MFKKLKIKFIIINMALLSSVIILIFGTIYIINWRSVNKQIQFELNTMIHEPFNFKNTGRPGGPGSSSLGILINLDSDNNIVNIICPYFQDQESFIDIVPKITEQDNAIGTISIDGTSYSYMKSSIPDNKIALIDRSAYIYYMRNLLKIFIIVGALSLTFLYLISWYFASKSINPIIAAFDKQKQFIADASHELRTPLAIIKTNLSLVNSNGDKSVESQKKWLKYIDDQTDRMSYLINDMLTLTKLESQKTVRESTPVNLNKILENILMSFEAVFFEGGITIQENYIDEAVTPGDSEEFKKLFSILIENAVKHTPRLGIITVTVAAQKSKAKVIISNTGAGIPKEELSRIFERFYRADSSRERNTGGYGLGLAIAKAITEKYNGNIYAESDLGSITSFSVELPLNQQ